MPYRNPTMQSYFGTQPWNGGATAWDDNRRAWGNSTMTTDQMVLAENFKRSKAAHEALMRGSLSQSQDDNALMASATQDEMANLFGAPRSQREARLQKIVQRDMDAKERGARLIPSWEQVLDKQKAELGVAAQQQNLRLNNQKFALDQAQFAQQKAAEQRLLQGQALQYKYQDRNYADSRSDEQAKRDYQTAQMAAVKAQNDRQYQHTVETEKAAEQRLRNQDFTQQQKAVREGEVSADALIAGGGFTPNQQAILRGHQASYQQQAQTAAMFAQKQNAAVTGSMPRTLPGVSGWFSDTPAIPPTPERVAAARRAAIEEQGKNAQYRPFTFYNEADNSFQPLPRYANGAAAPVQGPPVLTPRPIPSPFAGNSIYDAGTSAGGNMERMDGSNYQAWPDNPNPGYGPPAPPAQQVAAAAGQLMEGADGYLYRMVNGVPQRTNLRRRR